MPIPGTVEAAEGPSRSTLIDLLEGQAAIGPDALAYVFLDRRGEEENVTRERLRARARAIGARLQKSVEPGARVLLLLPSGLDFLSALFGCLYAGAIAVPVARPTRRDDARWKAIANDAAPALILTNRLARARLGETGAKMLAMEDFEEEPGELAEICVSADDIALIQYTSGSTAQPRGVVISHRNILENQKLIAAAFGHQAGQPIVSWLPMHHDMGLIGCALHSLYSGSPAIVMTPEMFAARPVSWLSAISRFRAHTSGGPDSAYRLCAERASDADIARLDLGCWKVAFNGAEPVRENTMEMFARRFKGAGFTREAFVACYGLAESTLLVSGGRSRRTIRVDSRTVASCGHAWGDVEIEIGDGEAGQVGEIRVRSGSNSRGYWGRGEESARVFGDGYVRTGDLGVMRDGELYVTGRIKDLIIIRGRNYAPDMIEETVATAHPALAREGCAAVPVETETGEELVILQEVKRGEDDSVLQPAMAAIRAALSRVHQIAAQEIVLLRSGSLHRTSSGKPRRAVWARQYANGELEVLAKARTAAPSIAEMAERATGLAVDLDAPLYESGLDSLALLRVAHAIEEFSGKTVNLADLLDAATLGEFLESLDDQPESRPAATMCGEDPVPLSHTQRALWLEEQRTEEAFYTLAFAARVEGLNDANELARAFDTLAERHAVLRMSVTEKEGIAVQEFRARRTIFERIDRRGVNDREFMRELRQRRAEPLRLERDGAIQATLFERENENVLLLRVHHLACDFRSAEILLQEVGRMFAAGEALPRAASYADFAAWQRRMVEDADGEEHLKYWREKLSGAAPAPTMPWSRARASLRSYAFDRRRLRIDGGQRRELETLARSENTTLFVVLLAGLKIVLARYLDSTDVLMGTVAAGRTGRAFRNVIGDFANPVALRTSLDGDPTVRDAVRRVRTTVIEALAHQDYPFAQLVERLKIPVSGDWFPLFQTVFLLHRDFEESAGFSAFSIGVERSRFEAGPLAFTPIPFDDGWSPFDLAIRAALHDGAIQIAADANRVLFHGEEIDQLLDHFGRVLEEMARAPDERISRLAMLSTEQRRQTIELWNDTARETGAEICLHERFERVAARRPDATAAIDAVGSISYGELNRRANRVAHRLRSLGVGRGVMVGLAAERSIEMVVGLLAILKAGGAYVPLDPDYPRSRLAFMLEDIVAPVLVVQAHLADRLPSPGARVVCLDQEGFDSEPAENPDATVTADDLAYVIFTSGSTGRPKGILLRHGALVNQIEDSIRLLDIDRASRVLQFASFSFDASLWEIFAALLAGAELHLAPREQMAPGAILSRLMRERRITHVLLSPSVLALTPDENLAELRTVIAGTERCPGEIVARWSRERRFFNAYGPTETTVFCTLMDCRGVYPQGPPIGRPLANTQAYILDRHLSPVAVGVAGELYIGGVGLAWGYSNRPKLTAETFVPNPFGAAGERLYKTGDRARFLANGEIEFLGRGDTQIKIRGLRIEAGEVEAALGEHPRVGRALVVARERAPGDTRLVAYFLPRSAPAPDAAELRRFARERLPLYMIPAVFMAIEALPLNPNHKVDVEALPAPDWGAEPSGGTAETHDESHDETRDETERVLTAIFASVLGLESVGLDDDFFEIGGDSVAALQIVARLQESGWRLGIRQLYENPSISTLARSISKASVAEAAPVAPRDMEGSIEAEFPLTPLQEGLLFHTLEQPGSGVYFTQVDCRLSGRLDAPALRAAWQGAFEEHSILRASVDWERAGRPVLRVHRGLELPWEEIDWRGTAERLEDLLARDRAQGFDVRQAPLLRARLIRVADEEWRFLLSHHHLLLEGWSLANLLDQTLERYRTGRAAQQTRPFADYVRWIEQQDLSAAERFWRGRLDGFRGNAQLSIERAAVRSEPGARHSLTLDARTTEALRRWARERRVTLATLIQGIWLLVMGRVRESAEVMAGVAMAGRPPSLAGVERMIGMFLNTVPVRARIDADRELGAWLRDLQNQLLEAEQYAWAGLANIQKWSGMPRGKALFDSIVVMENYPAATRVRRSAGELEFEVADIHEYNNYPLSLAVHPTDVLSIRLFFDAARFESEDVRSVLACFAGALGGVVELGPERVGQVLETGMADRRAKSRAAASLNEMLAESFAASRSRVAVRARGATLSYGELEQRSARLARELRKLGVGPECFVAICADRSIEMVVAILSVIEAGGAYLPLSPAQPRERLAELVEDAEPTVVLVQAKYRDLFRTAKTVEIDGFGERPNKEIAADWRLAHPELAAYVLYTSGSTGRPNGVVVTQAAAANHMHWMQAAGLVTRHDRVLGRTPFHFDASVWEFFAPLIAGGELVLAPPDSDFDPAAIIRSIREHQITVLQTVPTILARILEEPEIEQCTSLRRVFSGGEELSVSLQDKFHDRLGADLYNLYGPTETTIDATFWKCERQGGTARVPIGNPIPGVAIHILDEDLMPVARGAPGEIFIDGAGVGRGYLRRAALTAERFVGHPVSGTRLYRTRDLGRIGTHGAIEYLGRMDRQLKIHGLRVEAGEIESAMAAHPGVAWCAAGVVKDPQGNARLVAWLTERGAVGTADVRSFLAARLTAAAVPSHFVRVDRVPLLSNGKTDYRGLPEPGWETVCAEGGTAGGEPAQRTLVEIWERVLGARGIGIDDNFFDLGGDSIMNLQVVAQAKRAGLNFTPRQLFEHPRIRDLAQIAQPEGGDRTGVFSGEVPLTPIQHWFFEQRAPRPSHFNQAVLLKVRAGIDFETIEQAMEAVAARHEALHLSFTREQEKWTAKLPVTRRTCGIERLKLNGIEPARREERVAEEMARLHTSLDIEHGPLMRALLIEDAGETRLFLTAHHLCIDLVSWRVLLDDLDAHCARRRPAQAGSPREWSEWLLRDAAETATSEEEYWRNVGAEAARLPIETAAAAPDRYGFARRHSVSLGVAETDELAHGVCTRLRVRMPELLLTALASAIAEWSGAPDVLVQIDSHGRPIETGAPDLSRTIGWFTATYPVHLKWDGAASPLTLIKRVKQAYRAVPRNGAGYGRCRYPGRAGGAWPQAEILFNYGGNFDNALRGDACFTLAEGDTGQAIDGDFPRAYRLEIAAMIVGGRLQIDWNYSTRRDLPERVARLAETMARRLGEFAGLSRETGLRIEAACDFPLAGLDDGELETLLEARPRVEDLYPLSALQQGLLFHSLERPEDGVYFSQLVCRLKGRLDGDALRAAWQETIDRHEVLRAGVIWEQTPRPLLCVHERAAMPWEETDLRGCADAQLVERMIEQDRARPFDFAVAPLMRAALVRTGDEDWTLIWSHHHVILDGWSQALVLRDVLDAYGARISGGGVARKAARRFRDYIQWLGERDIAGAEEYWRRVLSGFEHPTPLGMADARGCEEGLADEREIGFDREETAALARWARSRELTIGTMIHAAWGVLLARYCGLDDVVFGVAAAGRPVELDGAECIAGLFINTLPVRLRINDETAVCELLRAVQAQVAEHIRYADLPLAAIRAASAIPAPEPVFQSVVITDNYPAGALEDRAIASGLALRHTRVVEKTNFPLALMAGVEGRLTLRLQYQPSTVTPGMAENLLQQMRALLHQFVSESAARAGDLDILTKRDRRVIGAVNRAGGASGAKPTILDLLARQAAERPEATALIAGERSWTRYQLDDLANRLACALRARGVGPEQAVAAVLPRSPELIVALLGIVKCGGLFLAIDPAMPKQRREAILADAAPRVTLTATDFEIGSAWLQEFPAAAPDTSVHPDNAAYLIYTSGSTGAPKGVVGLHRGLANRIEWMRSEYPCGVQEVCCAHINTAFVDMVTEIFQPLVEGTPLVIVKTHDELADTIEKHRVSRVTVTPTLLRALLEESDLDRRLDTLKLVISSGEALTEPLVDLFAARLPGRRLVNLYGSSEVSADVTCHEVLPGADGTPPIGRPIGSTRVYLVDNAMRLVPVGAIGRLFAGGECLARGYSNRPDLTAEHFQPDLFSGEPGARMYDTGDLARLRPDGSLEYAGRADAQAKIRGQRISIEEVERALETLPAIEKAAVVARAGADGESYLDAYLTPKVAADGCGALDFGLFYFSDSAAGAPTEQYKALLEGAQFADRNGLGAVWVPERHFTTVGGAYPNPSVVLGALAVSTGRVKLRAGSVVLPLHHPARVAEEWSVLDNLSGGRVGVAFTSGWLPDDFVFAPEQFSSRRAAMLDRVGTVRALWRGDAVRETNGLGQEIEIRTLPRPVQAELPVWLTCTGDPAMFERAGELGVNVLTGLLSQTLDQAAEKIALYRRARARNGFDPAGGVVTMMMHTFLAEDREEALRLVRGPMLDYVRAQSHLLEHAVAHLGRVGRAEADASRDEAAEFAFERYTRTASLIGSAESCTPMLERLVDSGVNEIACLVDFVPAELMLSHLKHLTLLRERARRLPPLRTEQVRDALRDRLPDAMIPARIAWIERLPVSETGKLNRRALAPIAAAVVPIEEEPSTPHSTLEQRVAGIWAEVFALPRVGIDDDFFAIGGHSLLAIRIVSRLRRMFGIAFSVDNLFSYRSVRKMSVRVGEMVLAAHGEDPASIERFRGMAATEQAARIEPLLPADADQAAIRRRDVPHAPLSIAQEQIWMAEQFRSGGAAYNESTLALIEGPLDTGALEYALAVVVRRHDALRAQIRLHESQPVQEFVPEVPIQLPVEDLGDFEEARRRAITEARRPFTLVSAPLFRAALWRIDERRSLFLITAHLLIADGWSWRVLFADLESVYRARIAKTAATLAPLTAGYGDFALWQRERLARGDLGPQFDYWKRQLASWSGRSPLGVRGSPADNGFAVAQRECSASAIEELANLAADQGTTLFSALLTCFAATLFELARETDIAIALPFAGRPLPELEELVGCFVNTVLVRLDIDPGSGFRKLMRATGEAVAAAQSNQEAPLQDVLRTIGAGNANVLFAVAEGAPDKFAGLGLKRIPLDDETGKFDLVFRLEEAGGLWSGRLVHRRAALDEERAAGLLNSFERTVAAVVRDPDARIGSRSGDEDCLAAFERQARNQPEAIAVTDGRSQMTYHALNVRAEQIASRLRREGVKGEDIVGLLLNRSPDLVAAILGCWKAEAAFVAVDPAAPAARVAAILGRAVAVLVEDDLVPRLSHTSIRQIASANTRDEPAFVRSGAQSGSAAAYVIFTSGSTGEPKGIVVEHRQIAAYTRTMIRLLAIDAHSHCGLVSSIAVDLGYTVLFPALAAGATLHLVPQEACSDPREFARYLRDHPLSCIKILPSHLAALTATDEPPALPDVIVFGGEVLDGAWLESLRDRARPVRVFNHYGPAETTVGAIAGEVSHGAGFGRVPLGRPLEHVQVAIVGPDFLPVANGLSGQIAIGGAGVSRGYLDAPALTAAKFIPDADGSRLYLTGDTGRVLPDGAIEFLGRLDRQIKIHGFRIEPEELEVALLRHPAIEACAVRSWPGKGNAPVLAAYVVLRGAARPDYAEMIEFVRRFVPDYMLPSAIAVLPALPLLQSGKVATQTLPHPDRVPDRLDPAFAEPATYAEKAIAEIWTSLFGLERVSAQATFLSLGGNSLMAIQMIARLLEEFGVEVRFSDIYECPTIAMLARCIETHLIEAAGSRTANEALEKSRGATEGE